MHYKNLFDTAEVEYIAPFAKLWVSFNSWYREDIKKAVNFRCSQGCKNDHRDLCIIEHYMANGSIKSEFLNQLGPGTRPR